MKEGGEEMIEKPCLLDTDTRGYILKELDPAYPVSKNYMEKHHKFSVSCLTHYECLQGYMPDFL